MTFDSKIESPGEGWMAKVDSSGGGWTSAGAAIGDPDEAETAEDIGDVVVLDCDGEALSEVRDPDGRQSSGLGGRNG